MSYGNLRDFLRDLEAAGELKRIRAPVDPALEVTEICQRTLKADGPALLFEHPKGSAIPLLGNLFGTTQRIARAIGRNSIEELREVGKMLAFLRSRNCRAVLRGAGEAAAVETGVERAAAHAARRPCREHVFEGPDVDLSALPIQHCWPEDAGRLITFGLVITKGPYKERQNIGIYRQQVIAKNKVIVRWLHHRGGAIDFREFQEANPGKSFPLAVVIGADPATLLAAVTPIPDTLSEFEFAGLLRGARSEVVSDKSGTLSIPASAEIALRDTSSRAKPRLRGRSAITPATTTRKTLSRCSPLNASRTARPIYHSSYMGRSPWDEPSVLAMALNEVFIPILQKQFPEIVDFYLPPEGCSYRVACVSIKKRYPGHARRIMFGIWSYLRQFTYTKFVIVTDDDINVRDWKDVIWAMTTRMDPARDTLVVENTPIDYLDFASPQPSLGGKLGLDATNKWPGETDRTWGRPIAMSEAVKKRVDELWGQLGI